MCPITVIVPYWEVWSNIHMISRDAHFFMYINIIYLLTLVIIKFIGYYGLLLVSFCIVIRNNFYGRHVSIAKIVNFLGLFLSF